ncbi:MAG TPA: hypothetical protein VHO04_04160 [Sphingopyxis sp.]|jgi:hypothetical protein|uniref:DUF4357 domain-containing protein n=1 Tax=Sphingopyxis sp. TaxID=1908224 RepID=UPI002E30DB55|nr:hypothetical protein [Sphingopyxis sp.]HEX2811858.1 hypothetical protein [Sphingopyxis sp.]
MHIDIDFDVFKALTAHRASEEDSYNDVLRRLLGLSEIEATLVGLQDQLKPTGLDKVAAALTGNLIGAWIGNVFLPEGTKLRATYKGRTFRAEITNEVWTDETGNIRQSPSEAAGAISGTNVNGWKFWYAKRPSDEDWHRLDELRK